MLKTVNKYFPVRDVALSASSSYRLSFKKSLSLWLSVGRTSYFITCKKSDIVEILGVSYDYLDKFVQDCAFEQDEKL